MKAASDDFLNNSKVNWLLNGGPVRQVLADIAVYERKIKKMEKENAAKADITLIWMEIVTKKTVFKQLTSILYDPILDVRRIEKDIVKRFFTGLGGFAWKNVQGWVGQGQTLTREGINVLESPVCLYSGIQVERVKPDEAAIVAIEMSGQGCDGDMPNNLFMQDCLSFNMAQNLLESTLPPFSAMTKLQSINMSGNGLTGTLAIASLHLNPSLVTLDLSYNELTGTIPDIFEQMQNLRVLNLAGNSFDGELPPSFYSLVNLEEVRLQNNRLTGEISSDLTRLVSLRHANLSQNQFTAGHNHFFFLENMEILQMNNNCLKGHLTSEIYRVRKLFVLQLQHNQLSGRLPDEICALTKLRILNLTNNKFRGLLPDQIGFMVSLEVLLLGENNFLGPVPLSLAQLPKLRDMTLFKSYTADWSEPKRAFDRNSFQRIYEAGPNFGIDSVNWNYKAIYGRDRTIRDDETVTLFSGVL